MSVAFRRESDEEHLEPKFELPIPAGPNLVTARGKAMIDDRVNALEAAVSACADEAEVKVLKRDLRYWQTRQTTAQIAPLPPADRVAFGSRVDILLKDKPRRIDIVGGDEADPAANRIAFTAPIARAILGAECGDLCDFTGEEMAIEIVAIGIIPGAL
jgi:transcription elongation GreA/GreB family factor